MNKKIYFFLIFALLFLTFAFTSGCGKYAAQYSAPVILSRFPTDEAADVSSRETIWVIFSKSMNADNASYEALLAMISFAGNMNAIATSEQPLTPEAVWSENSTKLTIRNVIFTSTEAGARVHMIASREAFEDMNGLYLQEDANLWNYTLQ